MGAGKSRVGSALARRLGVRFIDLDTEIERLAGKTVAQIFAQDGESGFRDIEHRALQSIADAPDSVVACGGGIVLRDENRALLRHLGRVVYLAVSAEEAIARVGDGGGRPLLASDAAGLAPKILEARLGLYRSVAEITVDTSGRSVDEVLAEVAELLSAKDVARIEVSTSPAYTIHVGRGLLADCGRLMTETMGTGRYVVVTDTNVAPKYLDTVLESLSGHGASAQSYIVEAGELSKNWGTAGEIIEYFADARLGRDGVVVALGGGVVGDLAGFAAAVYTRGVPVVQMPTTLLAQVDSGIGGKTGVDLRSGKNLAGAFWQPSIVVSDVGVLHTLPEAEWANGLVEVAKTALLAGEAETATLETDAHRLVMRDDAAVLAAVTMCARFKASVVGEDERESGRRECLNFGHTLGHALENVVGYSALSHGAAVAIGMRFAARLGETVLGSSSETAERIDALLTDLGVAPRDIEGLDVGCLMDAMLSDKKTRGATLRFVLVRTPGVWEVVGLEIETVKAELERWLRGE